MDYHRHLYCKLPSVSPIFTVRGFLHMRKKVNSFPGVDMKRVDQYILNLDERGHRIQCLLLFTSLSEQLFSLPQPS